MTQEELNLLITELIHGSISEDDHSRLQAELKGDADARSRYRERMDLEAALNTWASEDVPGQATASASPASPVTRRRTGLTPKWIGLAGAIAVVLLLMFAFFLGVAVWSFWPSQRSNRDDAAQIPFRDAKPACSGTCETCACKTDFLKEV